MITPYKAIKISDNVYWVGALDWGVRDFHGYATKNGTTYNAFLILADKVTLIDTVKKPFKDEMISRIQSVIDLKKIDFIVSNHAEMDHSGCLAEIIEMSEPEKVFASTRGVKALNSHYDFNKEINAVKDGDAISLGNMNLNFVETPMLHWPDSMLTFLDKDGVLFSQDGFGMHLATCKLFAEDNEDWLLEYEAKKYYANILLPFSRQISSLVKKYKELNLPVKVIAPDHGPLWRGDKDINTILSLYAKWAEQKSREKAIIVYDTMWGSTEKMAEAIADSLIGEQIETKILSLKSNHRSDIATELLDTKALIIGSPTLNSTLYPTVADCLTYLRGLNRQNLIAAVFGSFGWNGKSFDHIEDYLKKMKVEIIEPMLKVKYVPKENDLLECYNFGLSISAKIKESCL